MSSRFDITGIENEISLTDKSDELEVYCYEDCNDSSNPRVKECRGLVTDLSGNVVLKTWGYTPEYQCIDTNTNMFIQMFPDTTKYKIFESQEGCLIRIFHHNEKWYITTHKKLNAYKSSWSSKQSFGEIFELALHSYYNNNKTFQDRVGSELSSPREVVDKFVGTLDKSRSYMFLVRNTAENRIVCHPPADYTLYYTGSFLLDGTDFKFIDVDIPTPVEHRFDSVDEMMTYVKSCDPYQLQGVVYIPMDGQSLSPVKVVNAAYWDLFHLRNNEPSVKFRYLEIRTTVDVDKYRALYPEYAPSFDKYEDILSGVVQNIYDCYVRRFIKKEFATVPQEQYPIVQQCHSYYLHHRVFVSPGVVTGILNQQNAVVLNKIIRKELFNAKKRDTEVDLRDSVANLSI